MNNCRSRAMRVRDIRMKTRKLICPAQLETVHARDARAQNVRNWRSEGVQLRKRRGNNPFQQTSFLGKTCALNFCGKALLQKNRGLCQIGKRRIISAPKWGSPCASRRPVGTRTPQQLCRFLQELDLNVAFSCDCQFRGIRKNEFFEAGRERATRRRNGT